MVSLCARSTQGLSVPFSVGLSIAPMVVPRDEIQFLPINHNAAPCLTRSFQTTWISYNLQSYIDMLFGFTLMESNSFKYTGKCHSGHSAPGISWNWVALKQLVWSSTYSFAHQCKEVLNLKLLSYSRVVDGAFQVYSAVDWEKRFSLALGNCILLNGCTSPQSVYRRKTLLWNSDSRERKRTWPLCTDRMEKSRIGKIGVTNLVISEE